LLDPLPVKLDLGPEFLARIQKRQRVIVRLIKKFNASRLVEPVKTLQHFGRSVLELLERHPGNREGDAKTPLVLLDVFQEHLVGRQVAFSRNFLADFDVFERIEVILISIEDTVTSQAKRLVNLEIEAD